MNLNNVFTDWLNTNKISKKVQDDFKISFDENIIIPVHNQDGQFSFNKYRRSPLSESGPKYWYDKGGKVELYGWNKAKDYNKILFTEGEKDCLVAWSHNIPAITSTGGAMSFQSHWADLLKDKEVIICFDNDQAGAKGMVKVLDYIPNAKVLFIPDMPNVKDISDYVMRGGDLDTLIKSAKHFPDIQSVKENEIERIAVFQSTFFHDEYIKQHTKKPPTNVKRQTYSNDDITNAKGYPIPNLMEFNRNSKAICPYHKESTPSFTYFPKDNSCYCFGCNKVADSIDVYQKLNNCSFKEAVDDLNKL